MVKNILKDGTEIEDLTGHIVRQKDAENLYILIDAINNKRKENRNETVD